MGKFEALDDDVLRRVVYVVRRSQSRICEVDEDAVRKRWERGAGRNANEVIDDSGPDPVGRWRLVVELDVMEADDVAWVGSHGCAWRILLIVDGYRGGSSGLI